MTDRAGLDAYILQCQASGFSRRQVEEALLRSGWVREDFAQALERAYGQEDKSTFAKTPRKMSYETVVAAQVQEHMPLTLAAGPWPVRKILVEECSQTYAPIQPAWRWVRGIGLAFLLVLFIIGSLLSAAAIGWLGPLALLLLMGPLMLAEALETWKVLDTYRFSLQPTHVFVRSGAINAHYHLLPYENIQDAQMDQGLLERVFGVASVVVSTPASEARIPFLKIEDAKRFQQDVLSRARMHKHMAE